MSLRVTVIYHSGFGHTKLLAVSVFKGAQSVKGVSADIFTSDEAPESLENLSENYSAMILAAQLIWIMCPQSSRISRIKTSPSFVKGAWRDKIAAGFTVATSKSGSKGGTLTAMTIFAQHGMHWINLGLETILRMAPTII